MGISRSKTQGIKMKDELSIISIDDNISDRVERMENEIENKGDLINDEISNKIEKIGQLVEKIGKIGLKERLTEELADIKNYFHIVSIFYSNIYPYH